MTLGYTLLGTASHTFPRFRAALPWRGGDLQTIKNNLVWRAPEFPSAHQSRIQLPLNDGSGDVLLGLLDKPTTPSSLPLVVLIHGLTGCEGSRNIMTSAAYYLSQGFSVLRLNLRESLFMATMYWRLPACALPSTFMPDSSASWPPATPSITAIS